MRTKRFLASTLGAALIAAFTLCGISLGSYNPSAGSSLQAAYTGGPTITTDGTNAVSITANAGSNHGIALNLGGTAGDGIHVAITGADQGNSVMSATSVSSAPMWVLEDTSSGDGIRMNCDAGGNCLTATALGGGLAFYAPSGPCEFVDQVGIGAVPGAAQKLFVNGDPTFHDIKFVAGAGGKLEAFGGSAGGSVIIDVFGGVTLTSTTSDFLSVPFTGGATYNGHSLVYTEGYGRFAAQTAAKSTVAQVTVGAADSSYLVSANVNLTAFTVGTFTTTCIYTDEGSVSRTATLPFTSLSGTIGTAITTTTGPYEGVPIHIRAKSGTTVTIGTVGTFTTLTYNVEGTIERLQ